MLIALRIAINLVASAFAGVKLRNDIMSVLRNKKPAHNAKVYKQTCVNPNCKIDYDSLMPDSQTCSGRCRQQVYLAKKAKEDQEAVRLANTLDAKMTESLNNLTDILHLWSDSPKPDKIDFNKNIMDMCHAIINGKEPKTGKAYKYGSNTVKVAKQLHGKVSSEYFKSLDKKLL